MAHEELQFELAIVTAAEFIHQPEHHREGMKVTVFVYGASHVYILNDCVLFR